MSTLPPGVKPLPNPLHKALMPVKGGVQEVRRFNDSGLQSSIEKAIAKVEKEDPDARSVTLQLEKNASGLNAAIVAKLNNHWSVAGAWRRDDWGDSFATTARFRW